MPKKLFLNTIKKLRQSEELVLHQNILTIPEEEKEEVAEFLEKEFYEEVLHFPHVASQFNKEAALWAAETLYIASQLFLYRKNQPEELKQLFLKETFEKTASTFLSVDLALRFVPSLLTELNYIDPEDSLVSILEDILTSWHYSGINYSLEVEKLDFSVIIADKCLFQLYLNRVLEYKNRTLLKQPDLQRLYKENVGDLEGQF